MHTLQPMLAVLAWIISKHAGGPCSWGPPDHSPCLASLDCHCRVVRTRPLLQSCGPEMVQQVIMYMKPKPSGIR